MRIARHANALRWFATLKFKIIAMAIATAMLAAIASTHMALRTTEADLERVLLQNERDDGERIAAQVGSKLDLLRLTLTAVAKRTRTEDWASSASMSRMLLERPVMAALFTNVFAASADGRMIARIENGQTSTELPAIGDRAYFLDAMKSPRPVVSAPLKGRVKGTPIVVVATRVESPTGGIDGVIAGALSLGSANLFSNVAEQKGGNGDHVLVLDRDGTILAHPDVERVMGSANDEPGLRAPFAKWQAADNSFDPRGEAAVHGDYLVSMSAIPLSGWVLVHIKPAAVALKPLAQARRDVWQTALVVGLAAALLAGALGWSLTRPISRLTHRALRLLVDDASADVEWPHEFGEVGQLARAFQRVVEQRRSRQLETQTLLQQLHAVLEHAEVGIALSRDGHFEMVSGQFCRIFRRERAEMIGQPTRSIYASDEAYETLSARALPAFMEHGAFDGELELVRQDGQRFWARMRGRAIMPGDRSKGTIWAIDDVTEMYEQRERLTWTSSHDSLTGLTNRAAFEVLLERASVRGSVEPFCALFIDLDRFKQVNDTGGHAAGDEVLKEVARLIAAQVRRSDTVARLGGDEFAVLLDHCPVAQAQTIAEKIRAAVVGYALERDGLVHQVGASIGLVPVSASTTTAAEVLQAADAACYEAKRGGRNRVAMHAML